MRCFILEFKEPNGIISSRETGQKDFFCFVSAGAQISPCIIINDFCMEMVEVVIKFPGRDAALWL